MYSRCILALVVTMLLCHSALGDFTFSDDFNGTELDPFWNPVVSNTYGDAYNYYLDNSNLHFTKQSGASSGWIELESWFALTGDFTIELDGQRQNGTTACGLRVRSVDNPSSRRAAVHFAHNANGNIIYGYTCVGPGTCHGGQSPYDSPTTFRIERRGAEINLLHELNGVWSPAGSGTGLTEAMQVEIFMAQEPAGTTTAHCLFDRITVESDGMIDLRPAAELEISTAVEFCWFGQIGLTYQVQRASSLYPTIWENFGSTVAGTGAQICRFDSTPSDEAWFYRVVQY